MFDTGHYCYGAGGGDCDVVAALDRFGDRVWYIHCKDCEPEVAQPGARGTVGLFHGPAPRRVLRIGQGLRGFPGPAARLAARRYDGYVLVEQDILPGMGTPKESARRNREYLRSIESNFD